MGFEEHRGIHGTCYIIRWWLLEGQIRADAEAVRRLGAYELILEPTIGVAPPNRDTYLAMLTELRHLVPGTA